MKTFIENINFRLSETQAILLDFLTNHTIIEPANKPGSKLHFVSGTGDHFFKSLDENGKRIQDRLFKLSNKTFNLISALLHESPPSQIEIFERNKANILKLIIQNSSVFKFEIDSAHAPFEEISNQLNILFPKLTSETILVCDTNAIYSNIDIEKWQFAEISQFRILITTSVLADLDQHKMNHRVESVRDKAKTLINKIKEYRRRGNILEGVSIVNNKITVQITGVEPDFTKTFGWLNKDNKDDRLIAEFLELARLFANAPIYLVTADINLQTKCEIGLIPYMEPPQMHEV